MNADVQRGEQVNRSSSAVVFDVEHGLRRFLSVCKEQTQDLRRPRLAIWMSAKAVCALMSLCGVHFASSCIDQDFR